MLVWGDDMEQNGNWTPTPRGLLTPVLLACACLAIVASGLTCLYYGNHLGDFFHGDGAGNGAVDDDLVGATPGTVQRIADTIAWTYPCDGSTVTYREDSIVLRFSSSNYMKRFQVSINPAFNLPLIQWVGSSLILTEQAQPLDGNYTVSVTDPLGKMEEFRFDFSARPRRHHAPYVELLETRERRFADGSSYMGVAGPPKMLESGQGLSVGMGDVLIHFHLPHASSVPQFVAAFNSLPNWIETSWVQLDREVVVSLRWPADNASEDNEELVIGVDPTVNDLVGQLFPDGFTVSLRRAEQVTFTAEDRGNPFRRTPYQQPRNAYYAVAGPVAVRFHFSQPVDRDFVEVAFTLSAPSIPLDFQWQGDQIVDVTADASGLSPGDVLVLDPQCWPDRYPPTASFRGHGDAPSPTPIWFNDALTLHIADQRALIAYQVLDLVNGREVTEPKPLAVLPAGVIPTGLGVGGTVLSAMEPVRGPDGTLVEDNGGALGLPWLCPLPTDNRPVDLRQKQIGSLDLSDETGWALATHFTDDGTLFLILPDGWATVAPDSPGRLLNIVRGLVPGERFLGIAPAPDWSQVAFLTTAPGALTNGTHQPPLPDTGVPVYLRVATTPGEITSGPIVVGSLHDSLDFYTGSLALAWQGDQIYFVDRLGDGETVLAAVNPATGDKRLFHQITGLRRQLGLVAVPAPLSQGKGHGNYPLLIAITVDMTEDMTEGWAEGRALFLGPDGNEVIDPLILPAGEEWRVIPAPDGSAVVFSPKVRTGLGLTTSIVFFFEDETVLRVRGVAIGWSPSSEVIYAHQPLQGR